MECAVAAVATHGREDGVMAVTTDDKSEFMTGWLAERIDYHYRHINTFNVLFKEFHMEIARSNTNTPRKWPPSLAAMCSAAPGMVGLLQSRIGNIILFVKMRDRVAGSAGEGGDETTPSILERTAGRDTARARTPERGSRNGGGGSSSKAGGVNKARATPGMVGLLPSRIGKIILFVKMRDRVSCSAAGGGDETTPSILERTAGQDTARARTHETRSPSKGGGAGTLRAKDLRRDAAGNLPSGRRRKKDVRDTGKFKRGQSPDRGQAAQDALEEANMC